MFERFAEEARRATALASEEARQLAHDFIGTEHMLLGLLALGSGPAYSVLTELEVTLDSARVMVAERVHASQGGDVESPPFTPLAKKSLSWALREALEAESPLIGSEHLLLGLIDVPDGGGARILEELGGSLLYVRETIVALRAPRPEGAGGAGGAGGLGGVGEEPAEQTKAPVTGRTLRRWAVQGRTILRPTSSSPERARVGPVGPPPRCPGCQASLVTEGRHRLISVPAGDEEPDAGGADSETTATAEAPAEPGVAAASGGGGAGGAGAGEGGAGEGGAGGGGAGEGEAGGAGGAGEGGAGEGEAGEGEAVTVTVVYCGRCGVALGIA